MKVSTSWLKKWLRRTMSDEKIIQALEQAGIEIEQFISSKPIDEKVIIGLVKKVVQHPGADRLKLVFVDVSGREVRVVCGAPNVAVGMKVALAQVGTTLPSGDKIMAAKLRGELSEGMLCSERELGLGPNHDGILALPDTAVTGARLCDMYPSDAVVEVKTQANRFDLLSVVGLAREVAAISDYALKDLPEPLPETRLEDGLVVDGAQAKQFMLATLTLKLSAPSPDWMVSALRAAGVRPISPVVDVTNYVTLEFGQPLHAYDAAKVELPLSVRFAKDGETLVTLDGVKCNLTHLDLVVADATGPIGLAGVMGGATTEVDADTKEILLEAATFDPGVVRKTAKRHGLRTEASARFERGLPVQLAPVAMARAVELLAQVAGGNLHAVQRQLNVWPWVQRIGLRKSFLDKLLGFEVSTKEAVDTFRRLQIEARPFDIAAEARLHLGKPYKFGAKFKTDGTQAFDCSYLTDYLYSLIGLPIGHTAHEQFKQGRPVEIEDLVPGDLLFRGGPWKQLEAKERGGVSHVALYVGGGKIIHAADYTRDQAGQWTELKDQVVKEDPVEVMAQDPDYLGARRMAENLGDFMTAPAVPWWRPDLREAQDLVEEIVRVLGYERVPGRIPDWRPQEVAFDTIRPKRRRLQRALYGAGLFEVMTYSFVSEEQLMETGLDPKHHLKLKNPLSSEQAYLRSSLLPSHLSVLGRNRNYAKDLAYYELSRVFQKREPGEQPYEPTHLAITMLRPDQVYAYLKGVLDAVAAELGVPLTVAHSPERGPYADGRSGIVKLGNQELGWIGQLDPELLGRHKVSGEAAYLELNVDLLLAHTQSRQFTGLDRFPVTQRDLAVLLPAEVTWQAVAAALADLPQTRVSFVSDYYGEGMPAGHKSLALRLVVAHPDRTPTDAEAVDVERKALSILGRTFGAVARGN